MGFGLTTAAITTLGLIIGLDASTNSVPIIICRIVSIAIADGFADALAMHISTEASTKNKKSVWEAAIATFFAKMFFGFSFVVPFLLLPLSYLSAQALYQD